MNELEEIVLLIQLRKTSEALDRLMKILPSDINNDIIYRLTSVCHIRLNNLKKAKEYIQKACNLNPTSILNLNEWAGIEYRIGNDEKALELLNQSLATEPIQEQANILKATIYLNQGSSEKANKYAKKALNINPEDILSKNIISFNNLINEKLDEAKELIDQVLKKDSSNIFCLCNLALYKTYVKEYEESKNILKNALALDPTNKMIKLILKNSIGTKNSISRLMFRINNYSAMNRNKIKLIGFIVYIVLLFIGALLYIYYPLKGVDILLGTVFFFFITSAIPFQIMPQLNKFIVWNDPLGRLLLKRREIISSYITSVLLLIGLVFIFKFTFVNGNYERSKEIVFGIFMVYLSSLPFVFLFIKNYKEKVLWWLLVLGMLMMFAMYYFLNGAIHLAVGLLLFLAVISLQLVSNEFIKNGIKNNSQ